VQDRHGRTLEAAPAPPDHRPAGGHRHAAARRRPRLGDRRDVWRDVDLANGGFEVGRDKTDAGMREIDMLPLLREILTEHQAASELTGPDHPAFVTSGGKPCSRHNLR
jgi:hypothetical protein